MDLKCNLIFASREYGDSYGQRFDDLKCFLNVRDSDDDPLPVIRGFKMITVEDSRDTIILVAVTYKMVIKGKTEY